MVKKEPTVHKKWVADSTVLVTLYTVTYRSGYIFSKQFWICSVGVLLRKNRKKTRIGKGILLLIRILVLIRIRIQQLK
jgi:hypothetical protein